MWIDFEKQHCGGELASRARQSATLSSHVHYRKAFPLVINQQSQDFLTELFAFREPEITWLSAAGRSGTTVW